MNFGISQAILGELEPAENVRKLHEIGFDHLEIHSRYIDPRFTGDDAFDEMLARLKQEFDYLLIDTSPVLATPDPTILSPQLDATLLVLRSGHIARDDLLSAVDHINRAGGSIFAAILNGVPPSEREAYIRYGYGYAARAQDDVLVET